MTYDEAKAKVLRELKLPRLGERYWFLFKDVSWLTIEVMEVAGNKIHCAGVNRGFTDGADYYFPLDEWWTAQYHGLVK